MVGIKKFFFKKFIIGPYNSGLGLGAASVTDTVTMATNARTRAVKEFFMALEELIESCNMRERE